MLVLSKQCLAQHFHYAWKYTDRFQVDQEKAAVLDVSKLKGSTDRGLSKKKKQKIDIF